PRAGRRGSGGARRSGTDRGPCWAACPGRPHRSGRGGCRGTLAAPLGTRFALGTPRWEVRAAGPVGAPFPPRPTPSRGREPAAAAFGTEMPQRSCSIVILQRPCSLLL